MQFVLEFAMYAMGFVILEGILGANSVWKCQFTWNSPWGSHPTCTNLIVDDCFTLRCCMGFALCVSLHGAGGRLRFAMPNLRPGTILCSSATLAADSFRFFF